MAAVCIYVRCSQYIDYPLYHVSCVLWPTNDRLYSLDISLDDLMVISAGKLSRYIDSTAETALTIQTHEAFPMRYKFLFKALHLFLI